jgi:outer membrane lipoprotein LolB
VSGYIIRPASACKFLLLNVFYLSLHSGCAVVEAPPPLAPGEFELRGKVSVADGAQRFSARIIWQYAPSGFAMELWGPLGQGRVRLEGDSEALAIVDAEGRIVRQGTPDAVMREQLGWTLPLAALANWARGVPTPDLPVEAEQFDAAGRLVSFTQLGWTIACAGHQSVASAAGLRWLPAKVTARRSGYKVRMVVSQWRL